MVTLDSLYFPNAIAELSLSAQFEERPRFGAPSVNVDNSEQEKTLSEILIKKGFQVDIFDTFEVESGMIQPDFDTIQGIMSL